MTASGIYVRPIRISDLFRIRSMQTDALMPDQRFGSVSQRMPDLWSALPISRRERKSFVAISGNRVLGLIDLITDPPNHRWVLSRVLTTSQIPETADGMRETLWSEMMLQAIRAAGAAQAKRIHAVVPERSPVIQSLISTGFTEYAQDTVLVAHSLPSQEPSGFVRRQEASDAWAIHQLYHLITPRPIRYAEALTSNVWGRVVPGQPAARGYVVEDGLEVIAHCRVTLGTDSRVLHLMVHPDALHLIEPVVHDVAVDIGQNGKHRLSIVVPDYLQEYIDPLESIGFMYGRRQSRLVKYTVVARRMQVTGVEELGKEVRERAVTGAPSMYYSPPVPNSDGSSNRPGSLQEQNGFS